MRRYQLCFVVLFSVFPTLSFAAGKVSDTIRFVYAEEYIRVKAGRSAYIPLPNNVDKFEINIKVHNKTYDDIDAFVCDEHHLQLLLAGSSFRCHGRQRGRGIFSFEAPGTVQSKKYLVLNNSFSLLLTKKISYQIAVIDRTSETQKLDFLKMTTGISNLIQENFEVPEFDISIEPCGEINAFSERRTGNVIICSELLFHLIKKDRKGALQGIIFHEIGHSLLNLWGIPGNANEELVDEFAIVMMHLSGDQGVAYQMAEHFAEVDAKNEALAKIYIDSRHPLSPQRVRNIKRILKNPAKIIHRWNKILYPNMTISGLKSLLGNKWTDEQLARKLISEKEKNPTIGTTRKNTTWGPPPPQ